MRPRTTLLGVTFASSLHSFGMQTSEFRPRGAGALGGIKGRLGLSLEMGHDVADEMLVDSRRNNPSCGIRGSGHWKRERRGRPEPRP